MSKPRTTYTSAQVRAHDLESGDMIRLPSQQYWIEVLDVVTSYDEARRVSAAANEVNDDMWWMEAPPTTGEMLTYDFAWSHDLRREVAHGHAGVALAHDSEYVVLRVLDLAHSQPSETGEAWVIYPARELVTVQAPQ